MDFLLGSLAGMGFIAIVLYGLLHYLFTTWKRGI